MLSGGNRHETMVLWERNGVLLSIGECLRWSPASLSVDENTGSPIQAGSSSTAWNCNPNTRVLEWFNILVLIVARLESKIQIAND
jgi:hypothetical protein